jgi:hypothetical protein
MSKSAQNISIASHQNNELSSIQKLGLTLGFIGLFIMTLALFNVNFPNKTIWFTVSMSSILIGIIIYARSTYLTKPAGISNNGLFHKSLTNRGVFAYMLGILLTSFYVVLYWYPSYLGLGENGASSTGIVGFFDPFSNFINGHAASQWFVYGSFYTLQF